MLNKSGRRGKSEAKSGSSDRSWDHPSTLQLSLTSFLAASELEIMSLSGFVKKMTKKTANPTMMLPVTTTALLSKNERDIPAATEVPMEKTTPFHSCVSSRRCLFR